MLLNENKIKEKIKNKICKKLLTKKYKVVGIENSFCKSEIKLKSSILIIRPDFIVEYME